MIEPNQLFKYGRPKVSRDKKIVFEEEKSKYVANNPGKKLNCKICIDDGLIKDNKDKSVKRCDYGLWVEDGNRIRMILIELKGSDVNKAVEQLFSTHKYFESHFGSEKFRYSFRIVPTKASVPDLKERVKQFRKRGYDIIVKEKLLEETI